MDAANSNWWAKRRLTYNVILILAGLSAFVGIAIVGETACAADPDFEMTVFTIIFQAACYAVAMATANVFYGLGPALERRTKPRNLSLYRAVAFSAGVMLSVAAPLLVPVALFLKCTGYAPS
jgi:hypothetical protein